jgi:hypothetical protein
MAAPHPIVGLALQAVAYGAFVAVVGYFSTSPPYAPLQAGEAVVKLSFRHSGQPREPCRERTPEELAKLAPNMRAASVCPRERANVAVEVTMDGRRLFDVVAPPTGLAKDGASTVYRRIAVPAGEHRFAAKLSDAADGKFAYAAERAFDLPAGRVLVIDFDAKSGDFQFIGVEPRRD